MKLYNKNFKIIITILFCMSCIKVEGNMANDKITKDQAVEIANKEAETLGYDIKTMISKATYYDTPWNEYLPKISEEKYDVERKGKLEGKKYWAVYYYSNEYQMGGDLCVFVDSTNGNVLTNIRGK